MSDFEYFEIQADLVTTILQIGVLIVKKKVSIFYWVKISLLKTVKLENILKKCFIANLPVLTSRT